MLLQDFKVMISLKEILKTSFEDNIRNTKVKDLINSVALANKLSYHINEFFEKKNPQLKEIRAIPMDQKNIDNLINTSTSQLLPNQYDHKINKDCENINDNNNKNPLIKSIDLELKNELVNNKNAHLVTSSEVAEVEPDKASNFDINIINDNPNNKVQANNIIMEIKASSKIINLDTGDNIINNKNVLLGSKSSDIIKINSGNAIGYNNMNNNTNTYTSSNTSINLTTNLLNNRDEVKIFRKQQKTKAPDKIINISGSKSRSRSKAKAKPQHQKSSSDWEIRGNKSQNFLISKNILSKNNKNNNKSNGKDINSDHDISISKINNISKIENNINQKNKSNKNVYQSKNKTFNYLSNLSNLKDCNSLSEVEVEETPYFPKVKTQFYNNISSIDYMNNDCNDTENNKDKNKNSKGMSNH